ncbi:ComEA family DNA-binding protein [Caldichromatium japonicum]|nr:helix-hairpin-helix domain-containing protein [Caldichromatium japonicum]
MRPWIALFLATFLVFGTGVVWSQDKIDLNTATQQQLESLPGIGPALATRIVEYRQTKPFASVEEIKEVKGIGEGKFIQIKDLITVQPPAPPPSAQESAGEAVSKP